jgi:hypothetical protein
MTGGIGGAGDMDSTEGEMHPERSAKLWVRIFRYSHFRYDVCTVIMGHSRFNAAKHNMSLSKLFQPDKLAMALYPRWMYLLLGSLSGEIREYMAHAETPNGKYSDIIKVSRGKVQWLIETQAHMALMGLHGDAYGPVKRQMESKHDNK